ncbi:MAG: hypothetical protein ABSH22_10170, partial [Tepidisphaeraceae bacterium]
MAIRLPPAWLRDWFAAFMDGNEVKSMRISPGFVAAVVWALAMAVAARADVFNLPAGETSLQFVTVGDPGNAPDSNGLGSVAYTYSIGTYDITSAQYCAMLNAVAATDPYGLYNL